LLAYSAREQAWKHDQFLDGRITSMDYFPPEYAPQFEDYHWDNSGSANKVRVTLVVQNGQFRMFFNSRHNNKAATVADVGVVVAVLVVVAAATVALAFLLHVEHEVSAKLGLQRLGPLVGVVGEPGRCLLLRTRNVRLRQTSPQTRLVFTGLALSDCIVDLPLAHPPLPLRVEVRLVAAGREMRKKVAERGPFRATAARLRDALVLDAVAAVHATRDQALDAHVRVSVLHVLRRLTAALHKNVSKRLVVFLIFAELLIDAPLRA